MCVSQFRKLCQKWHFYYFSKPQDFNDRIDWDGKKIDKKVKFTKWLVDQMKYWEETCIPTRWRAYGIIS